MTFNDKHNKLYSNSVRFRIFRICSDFSDSDTPYRLYSDRVWHIKSDSDNCGKYLSTNRTWNKICQKNRDHFYVLWLTAITNVYKYMWTRYRYRISQLKSLIKSIFCRKCRIGCQRWTQAQPTCTQACNETSSVNNWVRIRSESVVQSLTIK